MLMWIESQLIQNCRGMERGDKKGTKTCIARVEQSPLTSLSCHTLIVENLKDRFISVYLMSQDFHSCVMFSRMHIIYVLSNDGEKEARETNPVLVPSFLKD